VLRSQRKSDPAASPTPMPTADATRQLSTQTLNWLANHPHARRFVRSVRNKLTELERLGQYPEAIDTLRRVLTHHQPTTAVRCRACRRWTGRRRRFPCIVWHQIHSELLGGFASGSCHRQPATRT
jgi:hypothetical protein